MIAILLSGFLMCVTFCYRIAPASIISRKNEYLQFILLFGSLYLFLYGVCLLLFRQFEDAVLYHVLVLPILLFCAHLFYPFKTAKKNLRQHWNFFLSFAALLSVCIIGWLLLVIHSMQ